MYCRNIGGNASTNRFSGLGGDGTLKENKQFDELDFALGLGSKIGIMYVFVHVNKCI